VWGIRKIPPVLVITIFTLAVIIYVTMLHNESDVELVPNDNLGTGNQSISMATTQPTPVVTQTPTPTPTPAAGAAAVPWSLIGGIIGGVTAAGLLLFYILRRRGVAKS
jgi:hypothetical protein